MKNNITKIANVIKRYYKDGATRIILSLMQGSNEFEIYLDYGFSGWTLWVAKLDTFDEEGNQIYDHEFDANVDFKGKMNFNRIKNLLKGAGTELGWDFTQAEIYYVADFQ